MHPGIVGDQSEVYRYILAEGERRRGTPASGPKHTLNMGDHGPEICAVAREIVGHRQDGALARWWLLSVAIYLSPTHLACSQLIGPMEMSNMHFDRRKVRSKAP